METKICTKCGIEKPNTKDYFCIDRGSLTSRCRICRNEYYKIWKTKNVKKCRKYNKEYRIQNLDKLKLYKKEYKEKTNYNNIYWNKNKNKIKIRRKKNRDNENKLRNKKRNERRKTDILFRLQEKIRVKLRKTFKNDGYKKKCKTFDIIGCTFEELKIHLELKFEPWMNWENHGLYNGQFNYGWDIDHIIPLASAKTEEEFLKLWHYTNLQPLCSKINRDIKKDNFNYF